CVCGDGLCGPAEDCSTCPADCGSCPPTNTTQTTTSCPTTTAPLTCIRPFSGAWGAAACPPAHTCIQGRSGSAACVGPPPAGAGLAEPVCGPGVCPPCMRIRPPYRPPPFPYATLFRSCVCGDGLCGPAEDCSTCPADCGSCPPTNTTTTTTSCPTTTAPLTCIGSFSGACGTAPCPPGQTCIEGSSGSCECVGPPPPCDGLT